MTVDVAQQGRALCQALLLGGAMGVVYDLFRILRVRVKVRLLGPLLDLLDAPRRAGLCATANHLLTPRKSVTAILGVSSGEIEKKNRSCLGCPAQGSCQYRKAGGHCGIS